MSLEKCRASAASASLLVFLAIDFRRAPAEEIDGDGGDQNPEDQIARFDPGGMAAKAPHRLDEDEGREREQKSCLGQRRQGFDLGVAVLVLFVGRLMGDLDGEIGERCRADIREIVPRLRQHRERARQKAGGKFRRGHQRTHGDRSQRRAFFQFLVGVLHDEALGFWRLHRRALDHDAFRSN